jgi:hypothetical protein
MTMRAPTLFRLATAAAALAGLAACADAQRPPASSQPAIVVVPPPSAMSPQGQAPMPMAPGPMTTPAPQSTPSMVLAGHLASYRTPESAQAGWQQLVRQQPALQTLKPYFVPVTINGQPWVRLLAGDFPNTEEVNRFCNWARSNRMYCVPMPVAAASQPNAALPRAAAPAAQPAPGAGTQQRQRQPRGTPQPAAETPPPAMMSPAPAVPPPPPAASMVAPPPAPAQVPATANGQTAPQQLAPPLPPRRQPSNTPIPQ